MTLPEISRNIINTFYGLISDDIDISERQVNFWVNYYRARLIKEYYEKRALIDAKLLVQDLGCIKLICVNEVDCCDLKLPLPNGIKRSEKKIPQPLDLPNGAGITFIGLIDKFTPLQLYDKTQIYWSSFDKYSKNIRKTFMQDNYAWVITPPGDEISYINIQGIFMEPEAVKEFTKCGNNADPCFDPDKDDYPIPGYLVQIMTEMIIKMEMATMVNGFQLHDKENNAKHDVNTQKQAPKGA